MPQENKSTKAELAKRVNIISELLAVGMMRREILGFVDRQYPEWNVSAGQIDNYIGKCYKELREIVKADREKNLLSMLHRLNNIYKEAIKTGDLTNARQAERDKARLLGLDAPDKHELMGKDGGPIERNLPSLDELKMFFENVSDGSNNTEDKE